MNQKEKKSELTNVEFIDSLIQRDKQEMAKVRTYLFGLQKAIHQLQDIKKKLLKKI